MRAVLIDDHALVRDAMRRMLQEQLGFDEVLEAGDLDGGLELLSQGEPPDLIMSDLRMPGSDGPESLAALVQAFPDSHVIVVSSSEDKEDVLSCLSVGVDGYMPKSLGLEEMAAAVTQVLNGGVFVPRTMARRGAAPAERPKRRVAGVENLTARQKEVLDELLHGRSSKEIARTLNVAEGTVKIHLAAIYRAVGVRTRAEAIAKLMGG